ncbi:MAG: class I SAM-dependent methyltransferase [Promethearchaeota archaeon]
MKDYSKNWDELEYNKDYLEIADIIIPYRKTLLSILTSFYQKFIFNGEPKKILDLGTGDGILIKTLFNNDNPVNEITVIDGSKNMLKKAEQNLSYLSKINYVHMSFQELIENGLSENDFDFIISSFAIHHLFLEQKKQIFKILYDLLNYNGYFLNIEVTTSNNEKYTKWYIDLWSEWIEKYQNQNNTQTKYENAPYKAPNKPENHFDPLEIQLNYLKEVGFIEVDCHYKYGMFTIYGGKK